MNTLCQDVQNVIYKYRHNLYMKDIVDEIKIGKTIIINLSDVDNEYGRRLFKKRFLTYNKRDISELRQELQKLDYRNDSYNPLRDYFPEYMNINELFDYIQKILYCSLYSKCIKLCSKLKAEYEETENGELKYWCQDRDRDLSQESFLLGFFMNSNHEMSKQINETIRHIEYNEGLTIENRNSLHRYLIYLSEGDKKAQNICKEGYIRRFINRFKKVRK